MPKGGTDFGQWLVLLFAVYMLYSLASGTPQKQPAPVQTPRRVDVPGDDAGYATEPEKEPVRPPREDTSLSSPAPIGRIPTIIPEVLPGFAALEPIEEEEVTPSKRLRPSDPVRPTEKRGREEAPTPVQLWDLPPIPSIPGTIPPMPMRPEPPTSSMLCVREQNVPTVTFAPGFSIPSAQAELLPQLTQNVGYPVVIKREPVESDRLLLMNVPPNIPARPSKPQRPRVVDLTPSEAVKRERDDAAMERPIKRERECLLIPDVPRFDPVSVLWPVPEEDELTGGRVSRTVKTIRQARENPMLHYSKDVNRPKKPACPLLLDLPAINEPVFVPVVPSFQAGPSNRPRTPKQPLTDDDLRRQPVPKRDAACTTPLVSELPKQARYSWEQWSRTNRATMNQAKTKWIERVHELAGDILQDADKLNEMWDELSMESEIKQYYVKRTELFQRAAKTNLRKLAGNSNYMHNVNQVQGKTDLELLDLEFMFDRLSPDEKATYHPYLYRQGEGYFETQRVNWD